jgi:hypothetical protein
MLWCKSVSALILCTFLLSVLAEEQPQEQQVVNYTPRNIMINAPLRSSCPDGRKLIKGKRRRLYRISEKTKGSA